MRVLVLEASTTAAKALVYDDRLGVVESVGENYGPDVGAGGLHDIGKAYASLIRLGRSVAAGTDIEAIAVGCVWHSVVACDDRMNPLTPLHLWNYTGAAGIGAGFRADAALAAGIYRRTGCMPHSIYPVYSILLMRENGLDAKGRRFASQGGFIFHGLTGRRCETANLVSGMGLLNIDARACDDVMFELCGICPDQIGELVSYGETAPLSPAAAAALGVAPGIPVVPPHADGALNQLGNGAMRPGRMTFSVGTSAAIRLSTDKPALSDPPATWCYAGVEGWMSGAATNGACNCVNWFKERVLGDKWTFAELERGLLDETPAPFFLPFLFGERCPGWNDDRHGRFEGLDGTEDAPRLFRAISEGVLFNIFQCYRILARMVGSPGRVILSGGILNSPKWTQMAADIFQRDLAVSDNPHASMLGAAALALHAAGGLDDIARFGEGELATVSPRGGAGDFYARRFARYLEYYAV